MSSALNFLHQWGAEHIDPDAFQKGQPEAERLAKQFVADGAKLGISEEDLEIAAGQDLVSYMYEAMENAVMAETERQMKGN